MHRIITVGSLIVIFVALLTVQAIAEDKKTGPVGGITNQPKVVNPPTQQLPPKTTTTPPRVPTIGGNTVASKPYTCDTKQCSCKGDDNCNKMFSAGVCTGGMLSTNCDTSGKEPQCNCVNKE